MSEQLRLFDGFEVQADYADIPGLGKVPLGPLFSALGVAPGEIHGGDEFTATVRFRFLPEGPSGLKVDRRKGYIEGRMERVLKAYPFEDGFEVTEHRSRAEVDLDWALAHGASSA